MMPTSSLMKVQSLLAMARMSAGEMKLVFCQPAVPWPPLSSTSLGLRKATRSRHSWAILPSALRAAEPYCV